MSGPVRVQGWDLSLGHLAVVQLVDGEMDALWYVAKTKASADRHPNAVRFVMPKIDHAVAAMHRLEMLRRFLGFVLRKGAPDYVGVEDYALSRAQGSHQLGELGGLARMLLWKAGVPFRAYDPGSIKMFTTGRGDADKVEMAEAVSERWGVDFNQYDSPPSKKTKKQDKTTSEDLVDAYAIAKLTWTEYQLRSGVIALSSLDEKTIQVFNRATRRHPVNILGRDWVEKT